MARLEALVELDVQVNEAFSAFSAASSSLDEAERQCERLLPEVGGITFRPTAKPVPMFATMQEPETPQLSALTAFAAPEENEDIPSVTQVVPVQVEEQAIEELRGRPGVKVWPSSPIALYPVDCPPYQPGVPVSEIQDKLGVEELWQSGARGSSVIVGVLDEGIDGSEYPVAGGFARPGAQQPGQGVISSHGSMCAADILVAAPEARLYDYPFLVMRSGGALVMMNAVLDQRRVDGTPHLISNSWGFYAVPSREQSPGHEVWDLEHPIHRKIREIVVSGAAVLFAAGNCGEPCPARCADSSVGPGHSIHGSNSLAEVVTVAAVNSRGERIGYSSQGPGMFEREKPDVAAYSHFFGNFGPGRPGGNEDQPFDNGTSCACPVAAGVVAALLSARPGLGPEALKSVLLAGTLSDGGWNRDTGHGIVDAAASFKLLGEAGLR